MKILLSRSSTHQVIGGAELSARDIARCLIRQGHECLLVTNIKKPEMKRGLTEDAITYSIWPRSSHSLLVKLLYVPKFFGLFLHYLVITLRFHPDILCPQSREDQIVQTYVGRLLKIPVVWRDPGDLVLQISRKPRSALQKCNRALQLSTLKKATAIFTLNADDREKLLALIPGLKPDKLTVIGSDILFEDYKVKERKPKQKLLIGGISQLQPHKGIHLLIDAYRRAPQDLKQATELCIVGEGPMRAELEAMAKGDSTIRFVGHQEDVSPYLNNFDIFVQPSLSEGWGRTIKEAKLFRCAIIGSNTGGIAKQLVDTKTGLLFTPGSTEHLRACLIKVINDTALRAKLQKAAYASAKKEGDWNTTVSQEIVPLFESALSSHNTKR